MAQNNNEWLAALENLNGCIATIKCGCTITRDDGLIANSLYYRCKEYMEAYYEAKF